MARKILSLMLTLSMLLVCAAGITVSAADDPLFTVSVNVEADIEVKNSASGEYQDGPVRAQVYTGSPMPSYDFKAMLDMKNVRDAFTEYFSVEKFEAMLKAAGLLAANDTLSEITFNELKKNVVVTGEMTTKITVPAGITVSQAFLRGTDMYGFGTTDNTDFTVFDTADDSHTKVHKEITAQRALNNGVIEIKTQVTDPDTGADSIAGTKLSDNLQTYLGNIHLECTGNQVNSYGTHKLVGSVEGFTKIYYDADLEDPQNEPLYIGIINYTAVQEASKNETELAETVIVDRLSYSGGGTSTEITVDFSVNGDTSIVLPVTSIGARMIINLDEIAPPEIEGYAFEGRWYEDPAHTKPVSGQYVVTKDTTLYTTYVNIRVPSVFNEDHYGYIQGYPDGNVKPEKNVTREETAALLYRLLKEDVREQMRTEESYFADVEKERWSHSEISTMTNGGYIVGYEDDTFRPGNFITRAEFATLITRFFDPDAVPAADSTFSDISGHWAEEYVKKAADHMMISGYTDGTFKPDKYITRAEAVAVLNRLLVRHVDEEGLRDDAKFWPDNLKTEWYYYDILEATNSHDYSRREDRYMEDWLTSNELTDWTTH